MVKTTSALLLTLFTVACVNSGYKCVDGQWWPMCNDQASQKDRVGSTNGEPTNGGGVAKGRANNGFGNGDQDAPGNSLSNNNAENDQGGRADPSHGKN